MKKNIPFFSLTAQYQSIHAELEYAVMSVMKKGLFTLGPQVAAFEQEFAEEVGVAHAVGVGSGTDALQMAVRALGLTARDEVLVPANAYPTAFGLAQAGVAIRLTDVTGDGTVDPEKLADALHSRTKAVVPVHLYGNLCDMDRIQKVLDSRMPHKIFVIEDAAQAHGAFLHHGYGGRASKKAGSLGDIGIFSFYPTKNLGAYGDGGLLTTDRYAYAKTLRMLRQYGESARYVSEMVSGVSRLDELQAAILRVKLRHLPEWNRRRAKIAALYVEGLGGVGDITVVSQTGAGRGQPSYHLFVIRTRRRDRLQEYLAKQGIGSAVHYPVPIHLTRAFRHLPYKKGAFPVSEALAREVLSLPIYPELADRDVEAVIKAVRAFFK